MSLENLELDIDTQLKQNYLRKEIIEKGYSPERFSEYLSEIKPDGVNIDVWKIDDLKDAVKKFVESPNSRDQQPQSGSSTPSKGLRRSNTLFSKPEELKNELPKLILTEKIESIKSDAQEKAGVTSAKDQPAQEEQKQEKEAPVGKNGMKVQPHEPDQGIIQVRKMEETSLSTANNVVIKIGDPEHVKGGIFSNGYVQYTIKTEPFGWAVKRRFNDFFWLRETLVKAHPGVFIPPIPSKKSKNRFEEDVVRRRMYLFEIFLNTCLENQDLKSDKFLYYFLYSADQDSFEKIRSNGEQTQQIDRLENLLTSSGEAYLDSSSEFNQYTSLVENYCKQTEPMYKQIRRLTKMLVVNMKQSANIATELSKWFTDLQGASKEFNSKLVVQQSLKFEDTYGALSQMVTDWSDQLQAQAAIIHKNISCFYKYTTLENQIYADMNSKKAVFEAESASVTRELLSKKERLYNKSDVTTWEMDEDKARYIPRSQLLDNRELAFEVMLCQETKQVKYQNNMQAYLNAKTHSEIIRGMDARAALYRKNFKEFVVKQVEYMQTLQNKWLDLANAAGDGTGSEGNKGTRLKKFSL